MHGARMRHGGGTEPGLGAFSGPVVHGDGRGALLGFPTANVQPQQEVALRPGVYACWVLAPGCLRRHPATLSAGTNPTFGTARDFRHEVHMHDFDGDLYGHILQVMPVKRLRDAIAFPSVAELTRQMSEDLRASTRALTRDAGRTATRASGPCLGILCSARS